jgi:hypothetical protein
MTADDPGNAFSASAISGTRSVQSWPRRLLARAEEVIDRDVLFCSA